MTALKVAETVADVLRKHGAPSQITLDAVLGSEGLGLDSVAIAEVLLDCETRFGVELPDLLTGTPLTVRALSAAITTRATPRAGS